MLKTSQTTPNAHHPRYRVHNSKRGSADRCFGGEPVFLIGPEFDPREIGLLLTKALKTNKQPLMVASIYADMPQAQTNCAKLLRLRRREINRVLKGLIRKLERKWKDGNKNSICWGFCDAAKTFGESTGYPYPSGVRFFYFVEESAEWRWILGRDLNVGEMACYLGSYKSEG